jgi:hypothetical protein
MTALSVGALSGKPLPWHSIDWSQYQREVRRLQTRIVKATQRRREAGSRQGAMKGLSRVTGNCPARFLGEGATVTSLPYPTTAEFLAMLKTQ